ncbi:MAG: cytochrome B561 [Rhodospirillaceae bacterium]|nr:MAG: cytochrome B561 [Rhodospirillaceae bacterium]
MTLHNSHEHYTRLRIWDGPTRLFHWSLVVLVGISWFSGKAGIMAVHTASGVAVLTVIVFRLLWGVIGSTTARFSHFVRGPRAVLAYLAGLRQAASSPVPVVGHNPAGGLAVVFMLAALAVQGASGLFANDDIYTKGPLAHLVSEETSNALTSLHKVVFNGLLALIGVHVLANLFYLVAKGENLIMPMITGDKPWPADRAKPPLHFAKPVVAGGAFVLSLLLMGGLLFL